MRNRKPSMDKLQRLLRVISSFNLNTLRILLTKGAKPALEYDRYTYRLYSGYGLPWSWQRAPWRSSLQIPRVLPSQLFPGIDFTRSPELLHPFPRDLGVMPHELMILAH